MLMLGAWYATLLATFFVLVCLFMMLVILIQKPRGGGLSGAFGGAGSAQAAFGAKTGDVLTWFTVVCFATFLVLAIGLTWLIKPADQRDVPAVIPIDTGTQPPAAVDPPGAADTANRPPADTTPPRPETEPVSTESSR